MRHNPKIIFAPLFVLLVAIVLFPSAVQARYVTDQTKTVYIVRETVVKSTTNNQNWLKLSSMVNTLQDGTPSYYEVKNYSVSSFPDMMEIDNKGNRTLLYRNLSNGTRIREVLEIETTRGRLLESDYGNAWQWETYTKPSRGIESDHPLIQDVAADIINEQMTLYDNIRAAYEYIQRTMNYDSNPIYANQGALNALLSGRGVCEDHTALMVALLRAGGIPARNTYGYFWQEPLDETRNHTGDGGYWLFYRNQPVGAHTWVEVFSPKHGWVRIDPTTASNQNGWVNWNLFVHAAQNSYYYPVFYDNNEFLVRKMGISDVDVSIAVYEKAISKERHVLQTQKNSPTPNPDITVFIQGDHLVYREQKPVSQNDLVLLPLRETASSLGFAVEWIPNRNLIIIKNDASIVELRPGTSRVRINRSEVISLRKMPELRNGRILVPLSFFSEALPFDVKHDIQFNRITID